jgi:UDP-glucose 4-epimerase
MKILITGINGFLGRNLIKALCHYELFGLGTNDNNIDNIQVFNSNDLEKLDLNIEMIIICHAAIASGTNILSNKILFDVNVLLTEKIVSKFKNAYIIYISTASIYDINFEVIEEKSPINPQSNYALSKLWGERMVNVNKKSTILRISSTFGIGMKENTLIPNYVNQALQNNIIEVWGKGERSQNYIHVNDVAKYINLIIENKEDLSRQILLGISKNHYSNLEIAEMISEITKAKIIFINEDNSKSFCYNNDFTTNLLNWIPKEDIKKELQKYIEWKQKEY